jgi:hypothetical protein
MPAPQLFLWEAEAEQTKPARVVPLHGMAVSLPDKPSKGFPHAFRFGLPRVDGGPKGEKADTVTLAFADGGESVHTSNPDHHVLISKNAFLIA